MKNFFISHSQKERIDFTKNIEGKKICIYNNLEDKSILELFDEHVCLLDLYQDKIFLPFLAKINKQYTLVLINIVIDVSAITGTYIKPYLKITPIKELCKATYIVDDFAFCFTEKAIYRPFLYIDSNIIGSSVQEFYNEGIYKDFAGSQIENYVEKVKPYIDCRTQPITTEVINYKPTEQEITEYEALKKDIIIEKQWPKIKVINTLIKYVDQLPSKKESISNVVANSLMVFSNKPNNKHWVWNSIRNPSIQKVIFFSSKTFGADELELNKTKGAIDRHNELIKLLHG